MSKTNKTHLCSMNARSVRDLMDKVNIYNEQHSDSPILSEDIVNILKEEETFILLYFN